MMLVVGSDTTEAHPIVGLHVKWAQSRGAKLVVIDPKRIPLVKQADLHLQIRPGTNAAIINAIMKVIIEERLHNMDFINSKTEGYDSLMAILSNYDLRDAEAVTGVPRDLIVQAARYYGQSKRSIIMSGLGVDEHEYGTEGMFVLINLALLTGNIGIPGTGIFCLRGQNNVQGSSDMGCLPHVLPGYQPVTDEEVIGRFSKEWGRPLPNWVGKKSTQMMEGAIGGQVKALYIWGEDPAQTHGDTNNIKKALSSLDFLVYQDMFMTETAKFAHVVLPVASFAEKCGTYTNTERRVRLLRTAIEPKAGIKADWEIFSELSSRFGLVSEFEVPSEVYAEMAKLTTYFKGISHRRLGSKGLQWPCYDPLHPGTERLYVDGFPKGRAKFHPITYKVPSEIVNDQYPLVLITGRRLYHFNNAAQTRHTQTTLTATEYLDINPADLEKFGFSDGELIRLISRRGEINITLRQDEDIQKGTVFTTFHIPEIPVNVLIGGHRDTYTDTYSYKFTAVRIASMSN